MIMRDTRIVESECWFRPTHLDRSHAVCILRSAFLQPCTFALGRKNASFLCLLRSSSAVMLDAMRSNRVSFFGIAFVTDCQVPAWGVSRAHPIGMWANTQHATSPSTNHVQPGPIKRIKVEMHGLDSERRSLGALPRAVYNGESATPAEAAF